MTERGYAQSAALSRTPPALAWSARELRGPIQRACATCRAGQAQGEPDEERQEHAAPPLDYSFADLPLYPAARHEERADGAEDGAELDDETESTQPKDGEAVAQGADDEGDDDEPEGSTEGGERAKSESFGTVTETTSSAPQPESASGDAGQPLPNSIQQRMDRAFGTSFGDVRIHQGSHATALGALAYTQGNAIHFAPGRYDPVSAGGLHLLAHELTHVVQQRRAGTAAAESSGILDDPRLEAEADQLGSRAARGEPVRVEQAAVGRMLYAADRPGGVIQRLAITWPDPNERVVRVNDSSTTTERPFTATFNAVEDPATNTWKLDVTDITGGVDIVLRTGGSRNPFDNEPTSERQARRAVRVMKGYYARGSRGSWHTEDASRSHEHYHYEEWKCASEHYWIAAEAAIRALSVPRAAFPDAAAALAELRRTRGRRRGADDIVRRLRWVARRYWFTLPDNARSRPYAAGQLELNSAIRWVQILALINGWNRVDQTDPPEPSTDNPCFRPHLRYSP